MAIVNAIAIVPVPQTVRTRRITAAMGLRAAEDFAVCGALALMTALPLAEIVLRRTLQTGITGAALIVQHLALIVGMLGGAIAAREGRLLTLSTLGDSVLRGAPRALARVLTGSVGGTIALFLAIASYQFVKTEEDLGKVLVY